MKNMTTDMSPQSRKPLMIAFGLATLLSVSLSVVLYFNEDLRRSTFVMLEKVVNEEGQEEVRVKIEKPEPNEEQIREITRNKERKKEERLKEKAQEIRESLVKIDEVTKNLRDQLPHFSPWNPLYQMSLKLERAANSTAEKLKNSRDLDLYPALPEEFNRIRDLAVTSRQVIEEYVASDPGLEETFGLLGNVHELSGRAQSLYKSVDKVLRENQRKTGKWALGGERGQVGNINDQASDFLEELERLLDSMVPLSEESLAELSEDLYMETAATPGLNDLPTDEQLEEMNVSELYESIQEMTALGDEIFAENRAAALAATEQMDLDTAREQVFAPQSYQGPDLQEALQQGSPENLEQYQAYSQALNQAERAATQMARSAANRQQQATPGGQGTQAETQTASQLQEALGQRASAMAQMNSLASNQGRPTGNIQDMRGLMQQAYQSGGGEGGGVTGDGRVLSRQYQTDLNVLTGKANAPKATRLNLNEVLRQAIPGRRLRADSPRKGWIFLDTWYIIGPWQRPRENSFETRFPPEVEVDLDGSYVGKQHPRTKQPMPLTWRFVQTDNIRVNPPDEISDSVYYAYTEVFAERAMEVVVAVASDDLAKLWVNDLVVWEDEGLSAWQLDEGFRRILLKPGYNKVLVRVENGPAVCYFSVLFSPIEGLNLD